MEKINLAQASKLTSPNPLTVICTEKPDGSTNFATVSWWTYLSLRSGLLAFAMSTHSYSGELVRENKKVILAMPGTEIAQQVMGFGKCSGRDTDKTAAFPVETAAVEGSNIRIPAQSRVAIQCALKEVHEAGDHYLYICEVEQVFGDESVDALFAWNGYSELRGAK